MKEGGGREKGGGGSMYLQRDVLEAALLTGSARPVFGGTLQAAWKPCLVWGEITLKLID